MASNGPPPSSPRRAHGNQKGPIPVLGRNRESRGAQGGGGRERRPGWQDTGTGGRGSVGEWPRASPALPLAYLRQSMGLSMSSSILLRGLVLLCLAAAWAPQRCTAQDGAFPGDVSQLASPPPSAIFEGDCKSTGGGARDGEGALTLNEQSRRESVKEQSGRECVKQPSRGQSAKEQSMRRSVNGHSGDQILKYCTDFKTRCGRAKF